MMTNLLKRFLIVVGKFAKNSARNYHNFLLKVGLSFPIKIFENLIEII